MSKGKLDNYVCDGQINLFSYLETLSKVCNFSGHTCNKKELWKVADSLDDLMCPHVCCRKCNTRQCGARCNGSEEPKAKALPVNIKGLCDDAYCPECGTELDDLKYKDCINCPWCGALIDWAPWHLANDGDE